MSLSHQVLAKATSNISLMGDTLEKVMTANDLADLSPLEKVHHIKNVCDSLGLNPLTRPIQLLKFQGKEVMYVTKDATEQLRKNHKVSITNVENKIIDGSIYIVTVYAKTPDGRTDASTGAITITGLKGDALCNAMLKAETKAKRRVTLSICGLGFIDESEADSMPGAKKYDVHQVAIEHQPMDQPDLEEILLKISQSETLEELEDIFRSGYKMFANKRDKDSLQKLIQAKDDMKNSLEKFDTETGEVK